MDQDYKETVFFKPVTSKTELSTVEEMARVIWREHYIPIIGAEQVSYMLDKFQSVESMSDQIRQGYEYFLIIKEDQNVGYLSFVKRDDFLFLSKIYVLKSFRRQGVGLAAMDFVEKSAIERNCLKVSLTVNKNNSNSIRAYEKAGFLKRESIVTDIGAGFVMDDYKFEKETPI